MGCRVSRKVFVTVPPGTRRVVSVIRIPWKKGELFVGCMVTLINDLYLLFIIFLGPVSPLYLSLWLLILHNCGSIAWWLILFSFSVCFLAVYSACDILWCSYQYEADTDPLDPGPYPDFCRALQRYQRCVDRISPGSCRGDLHYHSTKTVIPDLQRNYECERVLREENNPSPTRAVETTARPSRNGGDNDSDSPGTNGRPPFFPDILSDAPETGGSQRCQYTGSRSFRHCGLFGDPHLRTFDDLFQTCKVAGAWPLIYNDYLTAQVTNVPLVHGSGATATNKVGILLFISCYISDLFLPSKCIGL